MSRSFFSSSSRLRFCASAILSVSAYAIEPISQLKFQKGTDLVNISDLPFVDAVLPFSVPTARPERPVDLIEHLKANSIAACKRQAYLSLKTP